MQDVCAPFKSKHVTILGLGLLGRGVGDAEFLASCAAEVIVTDKKTENELGASVERLKKFPNIQFRLGGHRDEDFSNADLVIKAAGVPLDSHEVEVARKNGVPVVMSTALFAKSAMEAGAVVVGVTGTRGKSTVAQMIYDTLARSGKKVLLGGNVRGISTLALLPHVTPETICVLELDSWQLQGFGDLKISPNISVFTNLMPDHLNYYGGDMEKYFSDKANIFRYQKPGDALFVGKSIFEKVEAAKPQIMPRIPDQIPDAWKLKIPGEHNRDNASLAASALRALQVSDEEIKNGIESFEGVEGRLQFVREVNGVKIYNDNNATTPEATIAALNALSDERVVLIAGGSYKELPVSHLVDEIESRVRTLVLLPGSGTEQLKKVLKKEFVEVDSLKDATRVARNSAHPGDTILFSPAFASFGMFANEYERGDEFMRIVRAL